MTGHVSAETPPAAGKTAGARMGSPPPEELGVGAPSGEGNIAAGGKASSAPLVGRDPEPTLFELSQPGRKSWQLRTTGLPEWSADDLVPAGHRREHPVPLAEVSERDLVGHFTRLSHRQFSVDLGAYPLGSCTMKYNPKVCDTVAGLPGLAAVHPAAPAAYTQGWLALLVELETALCDITGMAAATLQPAAGAAGELTGLLLMRAYHAARGERRHRIVIPDSAHGTNPASVTLGGYQVTTVPSDDRGCVDMDALRSVLDTDVAGIMLTNPNTLGLFEEDISDIAAAVHDVGGLLYYDGANLNAILGVVRPGDMGFDVVHMNLHKTFATPHGGGGPGAGPVAVSDRLVDFLPGPRPVRLDGNQGDTAGVGQGPHASEEPGVGAPGGPSDAGYGWATPARSIGRVHSWHGNALVLARALTYILVHGGDGLRRVAERAVLNANWLRVRLSGVFDVPFDRPCMHEVVLAASSLKKAHGVRALDVAKRLLEDGFHSPTVYFPLIVDEALMVEPTETESLQTLQALAASLEAIVAEAATDGGDDCVEPATQAPRTTPVRRVDEARAARHLVPTFDAR
ncbi:MAG TPA: aminomethyl-transferring glycine dehydrogenase subunit GcvPB [Acidimicrobiales bacterium]|nr:aminomethyl-transferring glycine dehydrogenase subunit GcvPB [Acidimicrobiales bacterium]